MKILMIGPARSVNGGISAVVNTYYKFGLEEHVDVKYIGTMEDGSKWHKLFVAFSALFQFMGCVRKYDIVHVNMSSDVSLCRKLIFIWIAKWNKKRIVIHQHGGHIEEFYEKQCNEVLRKLIRKTLQKADKFLVIAPYLAEFFANIVDKEKIIVFPNSVFIPEVGEKDYTKGKILFLGRLCKEKGISELLDACKELQESGMQFELYLGGVWEDKSLKEKADACGSWLHQLGWIGAKEKDKYLRECNIFALPSYFEGQSVSLLEAMSYKCACVASEVGGIPQMLIHEKTGLFSKVKDVESLKKQLERYLKDTALQEKMGKAAGEKIKKEFDIQKNMNQLFELYRDLYI